MILCRRLKWSECKIPIPTRSILTSMLMASSYTNCKLVLCHILTSATKIRYCLSAEHVFPSKWTVLFRKRRRTLICLNFFSNAMLKLRGRATADRWLSWLSNGLPCRTINRRPRLTTLECSQFCETLKNPHIIRKESCACRQKAKGSKSCACRQNSFCSMLRARLLIQ